MQIDDNIHTQKMPKKKQQICFKRREIHFSVLSKKDKCEFDRIENTTARALEYDYMLVY